LNLPPHTATATRPLAKIGGALGFVGLLAVALLALRVFTRQRELRTLRDQVTQALDHERASRDYGRDAIP
jgi:hypothetical protein